MSDLTPHGVVTHLAQLARDLEQATDELAEAERDKVHAKEAYRTARAKAFLKTEGTQYIREAEAVLATTDERVAAELAEARENHARDRTYMIRTRIDVGRSMGTIMRAEMNL